MPSGFNGAVTKIAMYWPSHDHPYPFVWLQGFIDSGVRALNGLQTVVRFELEALFSKLCPEQLPNGSSNYVYAGVGDKNPGVETGYLSYTVNH